MGIQQRYLPKTYVKMTQQEKPKSGIVFSKGFIKFSAIFLIAMLLLMAFLHWRKGDYRLQTPNGSTSYIMDSAPERCIYYGVTVSLLRKVG